MDGGVLQPTRRNVVEFRMLQLDYGTVAIADSKRPAFGCLTLIDPFGSQGDTSRRSL